MERHPKHPGGLARPGEVHLKPRPPRIPGTRPDGKGAREKGLDGDRRAGQVVEGEPDLARVLGAVPHEQEGLLRGDAGEGGNAAASHLVSGRGGAIGIVTSNTADYGYAATIQGIEQAARARDLPVLISVIEGSDAPSVQKSVRAVASHAVRGGGHPLRRERPRGPPSPAPLPACRVRHVTAIACANDQVAIGAIRAILDRGLRVPEDISVAGFDDHPLAAYTSPPLTTVH